MIVKTPQRIESVILKVKDLANEYGASPTMLEKLYREMISGFINMEMDEFQNNQ